MPFDKFEPTRVGMISLARLAFEVDIARQWYARSQMMIRSLKGVALAAVEKQVIESSDAEKAIAELKEANIDALIILNGTFALGGLAIQIAKAFSDKPTLLWAWPEPQELSNAETLRLNSLVGTTVNASNLYKLGYRPFTLYASIDDTKTAETITRLAIVAGILHDLKHLRIGLIGGYAPGFDNLKVDKSTVLRVFGTEVINVDLEALVTRAKSITMEHTHRVEQELLELFDDTTEVTATQTKLFSALIIALREFASEGNFGALALKCWGDIVESYGIAGCGSGAVLNDSGLITACEGDVMGAITMFIAQRISGIPSFLTDLVAIEREDNRALLWHIGCAPLSLANPRYPKHLFSHFAGGKGVTAGFALKPGRITLLRLGDDGKNLRMIAATGTALETEMELRGTVLRITLDGGTGAFLDEMLSKGWEHHVVATYGDIVSELDMLCRTLQIPLTIVK